MAEIKQDIELVESKAKRPWLLIAGIAIAVLLAAGLTAYLLLADNDAVEAEAPRPAAIYHSVDSPFIVNFSDQSDGAVRYLQIKIKVMARNQAAIDAFQRHEPAIQHELLLLFYSQNYDDLNTTEGSQALQEAALDLINQLIRNEAQVQNGLEAVLFTSLIMQ